MWSSTVRTGSGSPDVSQSSVPAADFYCLPVRGLAVGRSGKIVTADRTFQELARSRTGLEAIVLFLQGLAVPLSSGWVSHHFRRTVRARSESPRGHADPRRIASHAQISDAARWNCCIVSRRSV